MNPEKLALRAKYLWWCRKSCELDARLNWPRKLYKSWFTCGARVPPINDVTTNILKACWDEWDKYIDDEDQKNIPIPFHYEDIHAELNIRNEGSYCAV